MDTEEHKKQRRTGAQCGTRQFLYGLSITRQSSIERSGVSAAAGSFLEATSTTTVTHRPLCPCGPTTVHCGNRSDQWLNTFIYTCIWTQQHLISLLLKSSPLRWTQRSQMTTDTCFRSTFRRLTATVCEKDVRNVCLLCVLIDYCNLTVLASSLQCWI